MRRPVLAMILILIGSLASLGLVASARSADASEPRSVYLVAVNHAPPFRIVESEGDRPAFGGIYIDIARALFERAKLRVRFIEMPFVRAIEATKSGAADVMLGPNRTSERERFLHYLDTDLGREDKIFLTRADAPDVAAYADLQDRQIGVLRGAVYFDRFDADRSLSKTSFPTYAAGLRMLRQDRVDVLVIPEAFADYWVPQDSPAIRRATLRFEGRPSFIAISRKSGMMTEVERLESLLEQMREDGTMVRIRKVYGQGKNPVD